MYLLYYKKYAVYLLILNHYNIIVLQYKKNTNLNNKNKRIPMKIDVSHVQKNK